MEAVAVSSVWMGSPSNAPTVPSRWSALYVYSLAPNGTLVNIAMHWFTRINYSQRACQMYNQSIHFMLMILIWPRVLEI